MIFKALWKKQEGFNILPKEQVWMKEELWIVERLPPGNRISYSSFKPLFKSPILNWGQLCLQGIFVNVWSYFGFSQLEGKRSWHLEIKAREAAEHPTIHRATHHNKELSNPKCQCHEDLETLVSVSLTEGFPDISQTILASCKSLSHFILSLHGIYHNYN